MPTRSSSLSSAATTRRSTHTTRTTPACSSGAVKLSGTSAAANLTIGHPAWIDSVPGVLPGLPLRNVLLGRWNRHLDQRLSGVRIPNDHDPCALPVAAARSEPRVVEDCVKDLV